MGSGSARGSCFSWLYSYYSQEDAKLSNFNNILNTSLRYKNNLFDQEKTNYNRYLLLNVVIEEYGILLIYLIYYFDHFSYSILCRLPHTRL